MKSLNKDYLLLFGASLLILILFGISSSPKISLTTSAVVLFILALVAYGGFVLLQPLFHLSELEAIEGPQLFLGEVLEKRWGAKRKPFRLALQKIRHILVTGVTGAGKSTLIRRFIQELCRHHLAFLYIDFKGERKDHFEIVRICESKGIKLKIFDLSDPERCLTCNLLTLFPSVEETVGFVMELFFEKDANPYYKAEAERFVRHSLELLDASRTTRSFQMLAEILDNEEEREHLLSRAEDYGIQKKPFISYFRKQFNPLSERDRSERFSGFTSLLSSFTSDPLARIFNAEKSELELHEIFSENQSVLIRIPGEAYGDLSKRIVRAFIKSLPILIARRREQTKRKDYLILLDEGCSYASEVMVDLAKKAGSAQVKLLVTRMSDADFTNVDPSFLGQMLSSFSTHFCFHTTDPDTREMLARISMTIDDTKATHRMKEGSQTGDASEREVQRFRNHPSEFGSLRIGECVVIDTLQQIFEKIKVLPADAEEKEAA